MPKYQKLKIATRNGIKITKILTSNISKYKQDNRYTDSIYRKIKQTQTIKKKIDSFKSELTGLEGKRITFKIRQDVLAKEPEKIISRLKIYYAAAGFRYPTHPYIRFIITLVGIKKSTQRKERFGISTPNQDRSKESIEELWEDLRNEIAKFYLEESPDWEKLTATRFVIRMSRRFEE